MREVWLLLLICHKELGTLSKSLPWDFSVSICPTGIAYLPCMSYRVVVRTQKCGSLKVFCTIQMQAFFSPLLSYKHSLQHRGLKRIKNLLDTPGERENAIRGEADIRH